MWVTLIDAILRNAPSYYMETWLSPVSAGSVMNDVTHGIEVAERFDHDSAYQRRRDTAWAAVIGGIVAALTKPGDDDELIGIGCTSPRS